MFWLGLARANWLERARVPSMVSFRILQGRRRFPSAAGSWFQDSGGFTELSLYGRYQTSPREYVRRTRLHADEIGQLEWVAIQDWMCEDLVLSKTGLTVRDHQLRTVQSYLELRELDPSLPWLPVLQGQALDDYRHHVDMYARSGIDLASMPLVGLGTVCRRQHTMVAVRLIQGLANLKLRLHGFGLKITSLIRTRDLLASSDSMSWSLDGRYPQGGRCRRIRDHQKCNNCLDYALLWRHRLMTR